MKVRAHTLAQLLGLALVLAPSTAHAQSGDNILLVTNALSEASEENGDYYARKRAVPSAQRLRIPVPASEEVERGIYEQRIERPISEWLMANAAQDRILYILLTKDVPLRVGGTSGQNGTVASVDSELTLLYRKMAVGVAPANGPVKNPYFFAGVPTATTPRLTHREHDVYLVGRLDGYTVADVKALIDRGSAPTREGVIVLDGKLELGPAVGNKWLTAASDNLKKIFGWSSRIVLDTGQKVLMEQPSVIGYYTWGSNAVAANVRHAKHQFLPGAIAAEYVSTDARTFREPPADWVINDTRNPFGGSHQSLIGDFIRDGITGVAGHVAEPYLAATVRADALFPAYVSGFNLIESFYMAIAGLSWQTVVIGDPLCAPFGPRPFPAADLNPAVDRDTEMPAFFGERRLATLAATGASSEVAKWMAKAEVRAAKRDIAGVRESIERATTIDPEYAPGNLALATMYEQAQDYDAAIERYRRVVTKAPSNVVALNNLAYALATRKNNPAEALPFAVRAYSASVQDPVIGDTLAWVHYLMGNASLGEAMSVMSARRVPNNAEVQLHTALILGAVGKVTDAAPYLDAALRLDASFAERADVKALQAKIKPAR